MIRGVIFDMDGVMTDTEGLFLRCWCRVMGELGLPEHREVVRHCVGLDPRDIETYVQGVLGPEFDYPAVLERAARLSRDHCREKGVPVKPGLYALLEELEREGIPFAVGTSAPRSLAEPRLASIGVLPRLRGLITGDDVAHGKPSPEIYTKAAEALALPPEACLVLEDSPHGILAARRAGCLPVMIPDLQEPEEETEALLFARLGSLSEVPALIARTNSTL